MVSASISSACSGTASAGVLTELVGKGACDIYLTYSPSITFWRYRYNRHTNYSMEAIEQTFNTHVAFGTDCQVTLNRTGDLIYFMYVVIDLPGIKAVSNENGICGIGSSNFPCASACDPAGDGDPVTACSACCPTSSSVQDDDYAFDLIPEEFGAVDVCTGTVTPWAHWTNAIGQYLVARACIVIGGQVISILYNDFLFMWEEVAGKAGKRLVEMIGKRYTRAQLIADSQEDRRLYVPLNFWFTKTSGNALPLVSLQFHGVQVHVAFEQLVNCVQVSHCNVLVLKCRDCTTLTVNDLQARLLTTYVYLDVHERDRFATSNFEQLIDQVQQFHLSTSQSQVRMLLNFNHPIIELLWAVKRQKQIIANNHFNYSGKYGRDPVELVHLRLNNLPRFAPREGKYFRLVEPFQSHSSIPESFTYTFSFALFPEDSSPTGSCNASRIDNMELVLELQSELADEQLVIIVFARNWNILKFASGLAGSAFSN